MGRKAEPGIIYYKTKCNHIWNKKIRLLFNEFDSDGYWIWHCLLSEGYRTKGYFFDCDDKEAVELFATDVCKKKVSVVEEVIRGCIKRDLFDKVVFDMFNVLTSEAMQEIYVEATAERRRKGTEIEVIEEMLLAKIPENTGNISIVPWNNQILPRKKEIVPRKNLQSRVEKSKVEKSISGAHTREHTEVEINQFKKFEQWILKNAARVGQMKEPFTIKQFFEVKKNLSGAEVQDLLLKMHNWKPLLTKNQSAFLTLTNWKRKDDSREPNQPNGSITTEIYKAREKELTNGHS